MTNPKQGRNVLLTGASSGIGLAAAQRLIENGFNVWGTSRELGRLPKLDNFHPIVMDMTKVESIRLGFAQTLAEAGAIDVVINNSGAGIFSPVETFPDALLREQFQLLVHGPLELIRLVLPGFRQKNRGVIINVTSLAARFPIPYLGIYSAAKAAIASFSETLRFELAHTAIKLVDLQPGDINTNFHAATQRLPSSLGEDDQTRFTKVWNTVDRNMAAAPSPQIVAQSILRILQQSSPPPVVVVGGLFQSRLAPLLTRLVPLRTVEWFLRNYYKIG